ncbi:MAG: hypothetical protein CO002_00845 [Candidatus Portnoybacteria bacterium CG_4_8_14_3_um_filter_44_10]|uniref:Excinuclease ABC subunit C n=4 Tax=Candidatus Portnoyibacteriota TaxID=1817913 RepID=A0A2H0KQS0_9BACT|nr:MAG: hypothetical protein AUK17_00140 [Parcubacteria group bacterium CG2_30_44_18]PIQ74501.1 MAG: hypothetical protein COV85_01800 [Candidatus Portnoybacteria bacterium CG11_big_fil_rev_8_21_14_0_20_44_10]PIW75655.1 MAG: hypothetical protein CO002_00845 [Candidatus Portnoybacteria bacterium CG_4_8_14_3_um_filter_44_10]PIZ69028.1 MAG: hypothetical protein COY11_05100 [Candidatus Portnoybacteria bacterium CG_4_10_14_0_2_um_filter_44_20]
MPISLGVRRQREDETIDTTARRNGPHGRLTLNDSMNKINLKKFPLSPGVYLFKDYKNRVIYVGRATVLRKRVASYFAKQLADPRIARMVNEAKKIDLRKTDNLLEAVILEANLIKRYWPKYNIREKDDRSFIYIVIPKKEWAYPLIIRGQQLNKRKPQKAHIFGPFKSYSTAKNLLLILRKIFPWSTCRPSQTRPCFYYQIGLCPGKCADAISEKEYKKIINSLILLLKGKKDSVRKILRKTAPYKLKFLNRIDDSILITKENSPWESGSPDENRSLRLGRIEGYDISHFAGKETVGAMIVFQNNEFDKTRYRLFKIRAAKPNDDLAAIEEMIGRRLKNKEWPYPDLILVDGGRTQIKTAEKVLSMHRLNIPVAGIAKPARYYGYSERGKRSPIHNRWDSSPSAQNDRREDKLVFGKMQKSLKTLISLSLPQLLKIRNEAHRFANSLRKKLLRKKVKTAPV